MSQPAKPKSSTSEATTTKRKIQKIRRCSDSEEEEDTKVVVSAPAKSKTSASESAKPRANITRQRVKSTPAESDDEGDEADCESDESEDEQTNIKKPVKATSSANGKKPVKTVMPIKTVKKQASIKKTGKKRAADSDNDEVFHLTTKSKKPKSTAASSSSRKKQPVQQVIESEDDSEDDSENDSEDGVAELTKKPTKSKPKATEKQPIKPSKFTPTKKRQIFQTPTTPESEDEDEEADSSEEEDLPKVTLTERIGDLFNAPPNTLLVHACNCIGSWNAGIALAFQKNYPQAYTVYKNHCANRTPNSLLSTCLLIPPQPGAQYSHWIGCLFTSRKYGRGKDSKEDILDSTDSALQDMLEQYEELKKKPKGVWMCKINSGSFKVPWMQTKKLIEALTFKGGLHIEIVDKK